MLKYPFAEVKALRRRNDTQQDGPQPSKRSRLSQETQFDGSQQEGNFTGVSKSLFSSVST